MTVRRAEIARQKEAEVQLGGAWRYVHRSVRSDVGLTYMQEQERALTKGLTELRHSLRVRLRVRNESAVRVHGAGPCRGGSKACE